LAALSLVCCLLVWFVGVPRVQDTFADGISDGIATEVSNQIARSGTRLEPGTHTLSMQQLEEQLRGSSETNNVDDITFSAQNGVLDLSFGSQGQSFGYTGVPEVENGAFVLNDTETVGGDWIERIFPSDKLANAVEGGVNSFFDANNLDIVSVSAENDELIFDTETSGQ
jgi:hypothetical protein